MSDIIIQSLHLADILDGMVSYCALTVDDRAFIDAQPTLARKNRMFLEVILSRGDISCEVFVDLLREDGHYEHLVNRICHHMTGYDECDNIMAESIEYTEDILIPAYKVKLQKNFKKIASIKYQHLFDFLLAKDVINFVEYEEIRTESIIPNQNRKLIDLLMLKNERAYREFINTLKQGEQCCSVAEDIETTDVTKEEQMRLSQILSDKSNGTVSLTKKIEELSFENEKLKTEVKLLKDPIPANVREHFKECIKDWEKEEERYIVTRATKHVNELLNTESCIIVTGSSGNGKSALIHHAALQLQKKQKYEIIPFVVDLSEVIRYRDPSKNQIFVIDDICGKVTVNVHSVDWWYTHMDKIEKLLSKGTVKLLASCRLLVYNNPQFRRLKHLFATECNLLSTNFAVLREERLLIASKYISKTVIEHINDLIEMYDFFPLLCKLYSKRSEIDPRQFFSKPIDGIRHDLEILQQYNKGQYCAIALVILFNNRFKYEWVKPSLNLTDTLEVIRDVCNEYSVDLRTQSARKNFKLELDALLQTYIRKSDNCYKMIHDKIFDIAAVVCGQHLSECFIKHADSTFIGDRFLFESVMEEVDDEDVVVNNETHKKDKVNTNETQILDENIIHVPEDEEELYFDRLVKDLTNGITYSAFYNKQLQYQVYRNKFIKYCKERQDLIENLLRKIEIEGQTLSARHYKEDDFRSIRLPLIECVFEGYEDIVKLLLDFKCDIDLCDKYSRSALHVAATLGYTRVVKLLLEYNANTSKINWLGQSALYAACEGGHSEIVNILLQQKVNSSNCDIAGRTPLFAACYEGHTDIVNYLIKSKKAVFACDRAGRSPFFVACKRGHLGVVKILLKTDFDIHKCANNGFSPLHIACQGGHIHIVRLLLANNFKVQLHDNNFRSPLHTACECGHVEIVQLLIEKNALVSDRDSGGRTPLYTASEGGHALVVRLLLDKGANAKQCDEFGRSPLYAACGWEHTEVVQILLETGDDVTQCDNRGLSALHVACVTGHVDSVKLLLKHNFPIQKGDKGGQTPLILACKAGHNNIVHVLLNNGADILQCDNNGRSPLYMAAKEGHFETVQLLLECNADPSVCDNDGYFPLHMAFKGHYTNIANILSERCSDITI